MKGENQKLPIAYLISAPGLCVHPLYHHHHMAKRDRITGAPDFSEHERGSYGGRNFDETADGVFDISLLSREKICE